MEARDISDLRSTQGHDVDALVRQCGIFDLRAFSIAKCPSGRHDEDLRQMSNSFVATDSQAQETHIWLTPLWLIRQLGEFDLDPCGYPGHATAKDLICPPFDGLKCDWIGRVWCNPPYGKHAQDWLKKLALHGNGIALVFARLETKWLKPFLSEGFFVIDGRLVFESPDTKKRGNAGCASILIPFGRKNLGKILLSDLEGEWYQ